MKLITKAVLLATAISIGGLEILAAFDDSTILRTGGRRTTAMRVRRAEEDENPGWLDSLLDFLVVRAEAGELHPTRDNSKFKVEVHLFDSLKEVHAACQARNVPWEFTPRANTPAGCAVFHLDPDPADGLHLCEIFAPRPGVLDDARTTVLGHELYHCAAGIYHD